MKILIIDDNEDISKMFSKYMTIKGHSCSVVNDGRSGLNLIENQTFDAIILDIAMPEFSGRDVIDELNKSGKIKNKNIVILTASAMTYDDESMLKSKGVRLCLKKPIDPDTLLDQIKLFEIKKTM
ncbi:MAG TPA: response regulator [Nitrosopumilaceae archaeon]|jgi:two-component system OmpR family response regulator|nr:response regulator [Nitrosopumilaceae archaeon]